MSHLKNIIHKVMHYSGFNAAARYFLSQNLFVLAYHSVREANDQENPSNMLYPHISISADLFDAHMKLLYDHGHTFITPSRIHEAITKRYTKPTIVYFDDGYRDNITVALPILEKYSIPATIFLTTGFIERTHVLWTIELRALLTEKCISIVDQTKIIDDLKILSDECRAIEIKERYGVLSLEGKSKLENIFLTWDEVKILSNRGVEIGSHGVSHARLTECPDEKLATEVSMSKDIIEKQLEEKVVSFSYPHGRQDDRINKAIKIAGYSYVTSVGHGVNLFDSNSKTPILLKNIPVRITDSIIDLEAKLYGMSFIKKYVN